MKKLILIVGIIACVMHAEARGGCWGGPHGRPFPVSHCGGGWSWGRGGRNFWPAFAGGVVGGIVANAATRTTVIQPVYQQPVIVQQPPTIIQQPVYQQPVTQVYQPVQQVVQQPVVQQVVQPAVIPVQTVVQPTSVIVTPSGTMYINSRGGAWSYKRL